MAVSLKPVPRADITDPKGMLKAPWQAWFQQLYTYLTATSSGGGGVVPQTRKINTTAPLLGGAALTADLTLSISTNGITNAYLAQMAAGTIKGNNAGALGNALDLTGSQVTAMLAQFTSTLQGLVPPSGGVATTYLNATGSFTTPAGTVISSANPSATIGLSAVNGTAGTFLTSDSAPALSQAITPTWTNLHTFNAGLATTLININGGAAAALGLFKNANANGYANLTFQNDTSKQLVLGVGGSAGGGVSQNQPFIGTATTDSLALITNGILRGAISSAGNWNINAATSGTSLQITAAPNTAALDMSQATSGTSSVFIYRGNSVVGGSFGMFAIAGTNASDFCAQFYNAATSGNPLLKIYGNGAIQLGQVATTTTAPAAGGAGALPATPKGYMTLTVGTTAQQVPYY